jgi:FolB domain-containing protein
MAKIQIHNLRLKAIIGVNEWERKIKQDVVINVSVEYDSEKARDTDGFSHAFDYKRLTKKIIDRVERSSFKLIEKLADQILDIVSDSGTADLITVCVEKPGALRHADSVSVEVQQDNRE